MSRVFRYDIRSVLKFSDEDLARYLELCWTHLIGVMRPEEERIQIIDYIEAIQAEIRSREHARLANSSNHRCLPASWSSSDRVDDKRGQSQQHTDEHSQAAHIHLRKVT